MIDSRIYIYKKKQKRKRNWSISKKKGYVCGGVRY